MTFHIGTIVVPDILKGTSRWILGQVLNWLKWILSLCLIKLFCPLFSTHLPSCFCCCKYNWNIYVHARGGKLGNYNGIIHDAKKDFWVLGKELMMQVLGHFGTRPYCVTIISNALNLKD
jgi:hypothetical protein